MPARSEGFGDSANKWAGIFIPRHIKIAQHFIAVVRATQSVRGFFVVVPFVNRGIIATHYGQITTPMRQFDRKISGLPAAGDNDEHS